MIEKPTRRDEFEFMLEERHEYGADDVVILDLDRTSIHSDNLSGHVYAELRRRNAGDHKILAIINKVAKEERSQKGGGYEYLRLLKEGGMSIEIRDIDQLVQDVIDANRDENGEITREFIKAVLVDGLIDFVKEVKGRGAEVILHTAGDELTQLFKIKLVQKLLSELAGLDIESYIITEEGKSSKTAQLEEFYDSENQSFRFIEDMAKNVAFIQKVHFSEQLSGRSYSRLTLLDDKVKHHQGRLALPAIRHVLVEAKGMPDDGERRLSMREVAKRAVAEQTVDK